MAGVTRSVRTASGTRATAVRVKGFRFFRKTVAMSAYCPVISAYPPDRRSSDQPALVDCSQFAETRATRRVTSSASAGSDAHHVCVPPARRIRRPRPGCPPRHEKAHSRRREQPSPARAARPCRWCRSAPVPGRGHAGRGLRGRTGSARRSWRSPPSSKSRCPAGNVTSEAAPEITARWSRDMP